MTTKSIISLFLLAMAVLSHAQKSPNSDKSLGTRPVDEEFKIDDYNIQYETRKPEEQEGDAMRDLEFDMEIDNPEARSPRLPTRSEVQRVYNSQKDNVMEEAKKAGVDLSRARVSMNPTYQYLTLEAWQKPKYECCPRAWNYQCRSTSVRQPCFTYYYQGVKEWCCPIWPSVFIRKCNCSQCAVLTSTCADEGRCQRRYSKRSFLAVCYRNHQWGFLRYITKYLPSSCYCRI